MDSHSSLVPTDPALIALMHGAFGKDGKLLPFAREIMLIECHVAGTAYLDVRQVEAGLGPGAFLALRREPGNAHDPLAIMIFEETGRQQLGYVPRTKNEVLARLMDAGKLLFGRVESKEWHGDWLKIDARIYMRDL